MRPGLVLALLLALVGCSGQGGATAPAAEEGRTEITVFAASSLTGPFTAAGNSLPQVRPTFSFAGSQQLVTQLAQGAPADVVVTADGPSMQRLVDAGLVGPPATLARTTLVIAVPPGNPKGIRELADLARPGTAVVLADPSVPAGRYARHVLDTAGVRVAPRSLELDVKAALAKVTSGAADAAIVYATDVRGSAGRATAVDFPESADPAAAVTYRIAVVSSTRRPAAAEAFVTAATRGPVRDALVSAGFVA